MIIQTKTTAKGAKKDERLVPENVIRELDIRPGMRVADFGCGSYGFFSIPAAKLVGSMGSVYAIDIIKEFLESLKNHIKMRNISNIHTIWSDVESIGKANVPRGTFDVCIIANTLNQLSNKRNTLIEAIQFLRKNGKILVIETDPNAELPVPPKERQIPKRKIMEIAKELGLRLEKEMAPSKYHYGLLFSQI